MTRTPDRADAGEPTLDLARQLEGIPDPLALLEGFFANAPVPFILFDPQGHPVVANAAYRAMFGAVPPPAYSVLRDEVAERAGIADAVRRAFAGDTVQTPTFWYDPKELRHVAVTEANRVAIACTFFPVRGGAGEIAYIAVTYKDVTAELGAKEHAEAERDRLALVVAEKQRLARALHESEERLRGTLEAAQVGTWDWDIVGGHVTWSPNIEDIFGLARGTFDGTYEGWLALVHPDDRDRVTNAVAEAIARRGKYAVEFRFVRPDGSTGWQSGAGEVVLGDDGSARAMRGVVVDATSQVEARELAEKASRAKDEFLAMLGHELRNPLAPILTAVELMRLEAGDGPFRREREVIERQVRHVVRLVDDLLDVSRLTEGKVTLVKKPVEIAECVAAAVELSGPLLEQHGHALAIDVPRGLIVDGDPVRLAQVFANLLDNAAKYTPPRGHVAVHATAASDHIEVRVRDDGMGIRPEILPTIFERFAQERQALDRSTGGLGLGLAIVRSLVTMHGGTVEACSEGRGRGAEIRVTLPRMVASVRDAETEANGAAPPRDGRLHVLVVDDNEDAAELLAEVLTRIGHDVSVAHDATSALQVLEEAGGAVGIALLDVGLPDMDGFELARRIHERPGLGALPLVAVTGYGQESDRRAAEAAGFSDLLVKPAKLDDLAATIRRLTGSGSHGARA